MFEKWELQMAYRVGELIKGIGKIIMEWATKRLKRLESDRPPAKPE